MLARNLIAIIFPVLGLAPAALAQVQPAWNLQYRHEPRPYVSPSEVLPLPGGGAVTVGIGFLNSNRTGAGDVVVAAFDEYGENLWTRSWLTRSTGGSFGLFGRPVVAAGMDAAGNVYITYSLLTGGRIVSYDAAGTLRWQTRLLNPMGSTVPVPSGIDVTPAGDVRVATYGESNTTWPAIGVEAFDASGNRTWSWTGGFNQGTPGAAHGVKIGPGGETYVYGQNDGTVFAPYFKTFVLRLDSAGQLVWYDDLATNAGNIAHRYGAIAPNGDLVLTYSGTVSNFPNSDDVASIRRYGLSGRLPGEGDISPFLSSCCGYMRDLKVAANGDALVAMAGLGEVVRVSPTGAVLPAWQLPTPDAEVLAIFPTGDGGAIVTAARPVGGSTGTVDARFDSAGSVMWLQERPGKIPPGVDDFYPDRMDLDIALGARGNVFISNATTDQSTPGQRTGITKLIEGSPVGGNYCGPAPLNSTGVPGQIRALGTDVRADDNLSLLVSGIPVGAFVLFLASPQTAFVVGPGGSQGNLCLGGNIGRYIGMNQLRRGRGNGTAYLQLDLDVIPRPLVLQSASVGETWYFQALYRDVVGGVAATNFTDGVGVLMR